MNIKTNFLGILFIANVMNLIGSSNNPPIVGTWVTENPSVRTEGLPIAIPVDRPAIHQPTNQLNHPPDPFMQAAYELGTSFLIVTIPQLLVDYHLKGISYFYPSQMPSENLQTASNQYWYLRFVLIGCCFLQLRYPDYIPNLPYWQIALPLMNLPTQLAGHIKTINTIEKNMAHPAYRAVVDAQNALRITREQIHTRCNKHPHNDECTKLQEQLKNAINMEIKARSDYAQSNK